MSSRHSPSSGRFNCCACGRCAAADLAIDVIVLRQQVSALRRQVTRLCFDRPIGPCSRACDWSPVHDFADSLSSPGHCCAGIVTWCVGAGPIPIDPDDRRFQAAPPYAPTPPERYVGSTDQVGLAKLRPVARRGQCESAPFSRSALTPWHCVLSGRTETVGKGSDARQRVGKDREYETRGDVMGLVQGCGRLAEW